MYLKLLLICSLGCVCTAGAADTKSPIGVLKKNSYRIYQPGATLGNDHEPALAINNAGQVVGSANRPGTSGYEAYIYDRKHGARFLPSLPGARFTEPDAINDDGEIIGSTHIGNDPERIPLFWSKKGEVRIFPTPPGWTRAFPISINNQGQVCGTLENKPNGLAAFIWEAEKGFQIISNFTGIAGLNKKGAFVGYRFEDTPVFYDHRDRATVLPENFHTFPKRIFRSSLLFAYGIGEGGYAGAFTFTPKNGIRTLPNVINQPGDARAYDLNRHDHIVGSSHFRAVLWRAQRVYDLNAVVPPNQGWRFLAEARGINDKGWICGTAYRDDRGNTASFLLVPRDED